MITNTPKKYGLIGYPLSHSFSQEFFNKKFKDEGIDASYINFEIPNIEDLSKILIDTLDLQGLNVTIPYKEQVISLLDGLDQNAQEIGAVNVIKITHRTSESKPLLTGYNTDVIGFTDSLKPLLCPCHTHALILGTGGASKAVNRGLLRLGIEATFVSRSHQHGYLTYTDLTKEIIERNLIIINTTPLGMYPNIDQCPDIPYQYLTNQHLCYDLVYNPENTLFMQRAAQMGAMTKNGLEMLHRQALAAWDIWNS